MKERGFTIDEKYSLRERDFYYGRQDNPNPTCQYPHELDTQIECKGQIEIHHILPRRFAYLWLKAVAKVTDQELEELVNSKTNGICICRNSHIGTYSSIHPDQHRANVEYMRSGDNPENRDKTIYDRCLKSEIKKLNRISHTGVPNGMQYWQDKHR